MLEFMHSRWLYLVAALVIAAVVAAVLQDPEPAPVPAVATPPENATTADLSKYDPAEPRPPDAATRDINLALVIVPPRRSLAIPEDLEARLTELAAAAEAGAPDAADNLFLLALQCSPDTTFPMPSTDATYAEARERLIQTRTLTGGGPPVRNLDRALADLDEGYRLCSAFERLGLPGHAHWNRVAAELGSHYAMVFYWEVQHGTGEWESVQTRSIEYLERARDEGYAPAFFNIGLMRGEIASIGPFSPNHTEALAHLYASADLQAAVIAGREETGYYTDDPRLRGVDETRQGITTEFVRRLEMQVFPYQMDAARERADELLDRCCR